MKNAGVRLRVVDVVMIGAILGALPGMSLAAYHHGEYLSDQYTVGLYHFNGDFQDSSGNGNHLTVENPRGYIQLTPNGCPWHDGYGGFGSALYLSQADTGWSDQTRLSSGGLRYPGSGSWTVETLVLVPEATSGAYFAAHYSEHWAGHDPFILGYNTDTAPGGGASFTAFHGQTWDVVHTPMSRGAWHHLAGVYDAPAGMLKIYVDGDFRGAAPTSGMENLQSYLVYIGGSWFGIDGPLYLDELRVSTVARTEFLPEPATLLLFGLGGFAVMRRSRRGTGR